MNWGILLVVAGDSLRMDSNDSEADAGGEDTSDSREQGVEIGALAEELEDHSYPTSTEELLAEYGDYEVELPSGSASLEEVLGEGSAGSQTYESPDEVRQMIYNMVGAEAVGRKGYTDRGGVEGTEDAGTDDSF
jgi:hypothetical protein